MKKMLLVFGLLALTSVTLWAQSGGQSAAPTALPKHVLKATYISDSTASKSLSGGFTTLDAVNTVVCPGPSGTCLLRADQLVLLGQTSGAGNLTGNCFLVDGVQVDGCPETGEVGAPFAQFPSSHGITVSAGSHTVQSSVFVLLNANLGTYFITYRVYKP